MADTVLDYGDRALLLQFDSTAEVLAWAAALRDAAIPGVLDIVPAARTVLLTLDGPHGQSAVRRRLGTLRVAADAVSTAPTEPAVIDVVYDGADLAEVAQRTELTTAQVIEAHTAQPVAGRILRLRTGFRVSGRWRPATDGAATGRAAACRTGRRSRAGRRIHRNLPASLPRRMAADRAHRRGAVGYRPAESGAADAGHVGPVPGGEP